MNPIRKEWSIYLRDGRVGLLLLALGGLFFAAALMTGWQQQSHRQAAAQAADAEYARWLKQPRKFAHSAAHYGMWAFRSPASLAGVDPGITAFVGSAVWMEAHQQNESLYRPAQDAAVNEYFGSLSPAVVLGTFAPLLILLMGFGTVAREREQGTWTLSLVQGQKIGRMVFAKAAALAGLAAMTLIPGLLTMGAFVHASGGADADAWLRLAVWNLSGLSYVSAIALSVVALSLFVRGAARVLGVGLAIWVVAFVLLPRFANSIAAGVAPLPTQVGFFRDLKGTLAQPDSEGAQRLAEFQQRLMRESGATEVAKLPVNLVGTRLQAGEDHGNKIFDAKWSGLFDSIDRQRSLAHWAGVVSPVVAFRALSQTVAGTDFAQHRAFIEQAETHRRTIQRLMNAEIERHPERDGQRHLSGEELWRNVPSFEYSLPELGALRGEWLMPLLIVAVWFLAAAALLTVLAKGEARRQA